MRNKKRGKSRSRKAGKQRIIRAEKQGKAEKPTAEKQKSNQTGKQEIKKYAQNGKKIGILCKYWMLCIVQWEKASMWHARWASKLCPFTGRKGFNAAILCLSNLPKPSQLGKTCCAQVQPVQRQNSKPWSKLSRINQTQCKKKITITIPFDCDTTARWHLSLRLFCMWASFV